MPQDYQKSKPRHNADEQPNAEDKIQEAKDRAFSDNSDVLARRDPDQSHDYKGEAQNINDDTGRPLNEDELAHARNKATQGLQQNDTGS